MNLQILKCARDAIGDGTPMAIDCGRYCSVACCRPDADGQGGVILFPGEAGFIRAQEWAEVRRLPIWADGGEAELLICSGRCDRALRPLGCMIFPLTPLIGDAEAIQVAMDRRAQAMCPLVRDGASGLRQDFVSRVQKAMQLIASDPQGAAFLRRWQALEAQYHFSL